MTNTFTRTTRRWSAVLAALCFAGAASGQALPDLSVSNIDKSLVRTNTLTLSLSGNLKATVSNLGAGSANGTVNVMAFYDTKRKGHFDPKHDKVLGIGRVNLALAAGQNTPVTIGLSGELPFKDAPISVWADSHHEMRESVENNNVVSSAASAVSSRVLQDIATAPGSLKWSWPGSQAYPGYNQVTSLTPVGPLDDTNGDGKYDANDEPRVVAVAWASCYYCGGYLHVLSGKTGAELRTFAQPVQAVVAPAIADLDGDGKPEIITITQSRQLIALNADLTVKWISPVPLPLATVNFGGITVADIDGDGSPEIFWGNLVFNANGSLKWTAATSNYGGSCCFHGDFLSSPVVTKLSPTGPQVLILGAAAFSANGTKLWENTSVGDGQVAVADLDKDGIPEIVLYNSTGNKLYAFRPDGSLKWGPVFANGSNEAYSPPVVADFNGDGYPDVGVSDILVDLGSGNGSGQSFTTYDRSGNRLWASVVNAGLAPGGVPTAFDFDGNGTTSPIILGLQKANIFNGVNGSISAQISAGGFFANHPIAVDVDGDGVADLVFGSASAYQVGAAAGVFAYSNPNWAGSRKSWNQYAYSINNINDDMSVPRNPLANWQTHNTYRVNLPIVSGGTAGGLDISASKLRLLKGECRGRDDDDDECGCDHHHYNNGKSTRISVRIGNAGSVAVPKHIPVSVYGQTRTGLTWLGSGRTNERLASGEYDDVKIHLRSLAGVTKLVVVADDGGTGSGILTEISRSNNTAELALRH
jgi:FG-GAP-like repeat/CARDB